MAKCPVCEGHGKINDNLIYTDSELKDMYYRFKQRGLAIKQLIYLLKKSGITERQFYKRINLGSKRQ